MNEIPAEMGHQTQPPERSGENNEKALEERFSHYEDHGGKLPISTYQKVVTLVESGKPLSLGTAIKAQAKNEAQVVGITNGNKLLQKLTNIYGVMVENTENVLELPNPRPEGFQAGEHPTNWGQKRTFAEALLIAGLIEGHEKYMARHPNIFG